MNPDQTYQSDCPACRVARRMNLSEVDIALLHELDVSDEVLLAKVALRCKRAEGSEPLS
jgi:hypothetical protein